MILKDQMVHFATLQIGTLICLGNFGIVKMHTDGTEQLLQYQKHFKQSRLTLLVSTGREGEWDATNPQMLLYLNGEIKQGLDVNHRYVVLSDSAKAGEVIDLAILAFGGTDAESIIVESQIAVLDVEVESLYYDLLNPISSARLLKKHDAVNSMRIMKTIEPVLDVLDFRKPYSDRFYKSVDHARRLLKESFYSEIDQSVPVVSAIGHTHIDIAWLWTVEVTKEKVVRSFSTVLELMKRYPDYKFMSSQPILYKYIKDQHPQMFEEIKERVREKRWEIDGGMWLEADCNIPSGESLVRQIMHGEKFFEKEFGIRSKSLWLPDVFGYSAALPQILKQCGINHFMTTKIAWNQYNQLPNDTFMWRGIDGSEVFTFMSTTCDYDKSLGLNISFTDTRNTTTYTGVVNPNMALGTYERFQNKDLTENTLMLFGFGDGGGGPTREMLENAKRLKYGLPGIPRIEQEFESDFFTRTHNKISQLDNMPTWDGELYFEYHRGTYTSMGINKRYNRKCEILYRDIEMLGAASIALDYEYPVDVINRGWDILLLNQFHDIIPGTSIEAVYETSTSEYEEILNTGQNTRETVAKSIASHINITEDSVVVFNSLPYLRSDLVEVNCKGIIINGLTDSSGRMYPIQKIEDDKAIFFAEDIPSMGYKTFKICDSVNSNSNNSSELIDVTSGKMFFENGYYEVQFNEKMEILKLIEKTTGKSLIGEGKLGNRLITFEDRPMQWDNWDIDAFHKRKMYLSDSSSKPQLVENGPVRIAVQISHHFEASTVKQTIYLYHDSPRIDFKNIVDWNEHNVLLKRSFQ